MNRASPAGAATILEICACPECSSDLTFAAAKLRCTRCGHDFEVVRGVPILMPASSGDLGERYVKNYARIATDDLVKPLEGNRPARHKKLVDFIGSVRGQRVLDIGSSDAEYLRAMDAATKVAVDIAIEYLFAIPRDVNVLGVCGDAERLPIKAGYFDVVIISDVLEHVLHPERVVEHLRRICRADTRLIVHVPWEEDLSQYSESPYEFTHLRSFGATTIGSLFSDFYERRSRPTYPKLEALPYRLYGVVPRPVYNWLAFLERTRIGGFMTRRTEVWAAELPRREWWLLLIYRPLFRMFEFRTLEHTRRYRLLQWLRRRLKRDTS